MRRSYIIAALMAVLTFGWVYSGQIDGLAPTRADDTAQTEVGEDLPTVRIMLSQARSLRDRITVQGQTEANRRVTVRTEVQGRVVAVEAAEGDWVQAGDVIARLEVNERQAMVDGARALVEQYRIEYNAVRKLSERGFQSEVRRAEAKASYDASVAALRQAELQLEKTVLTAPFAGYVDARMVEIGDFVDVGQEIAEIADLDPITVVGSVSERNVGLVRPGNFVTIRFLGGRSAKGPVTFVAASTDPVTRTVAVEVSVPNPSRNLIDGLTAELQIPITQRQGHLVSPAILTLADDGAIGVKLVDRNDIVRFVPVELLGETEDGVWLGGLPNEARLITVGQEFVIDGQKVVPVDAAQPRDAS